MCIHSVHWNCYQGSAPFIKHTRLKPFEMCDGIIVLSKFGLKYKKMKRVWHCPWTKIGQDAKLHCIE